jgi:hypothetical protein
MIDRDQRFSDLKTKSKISKPIIVTPRQIKLKANLPQMSKVGSN